MKKMILAAVLSLSSSAFANMCEVDMVDRYSNRRITSFRAYDFNDDCKEGMKECRKEIRLRGLLNRADCVRVDNRFPTPTPNPYPYPNPNPGPGYSDARRMLNNGELAVFNNRFVTVVGVSYSGMYAVRSNDVFNTITNNVRRESLAVANGCSIDVCTNDTLIDIRTNRYVRVVGVQFDERFVTESIDVFKSLTSNIERRNLAITKKVCISSRYSRICVGDQVVNNMNRYSTVVGLQLDGRVVLESLDVFRTITSNVSPDNLVVTNQR